LFNITLAVFIYIHDENKFTDNILSSIKEAHEWSYVQKFTLPPANKDVMNRFENGCLAAVS